MRKKVDSRVRTLVENGVKTRTRSLFVIVGDRGRDQVVNLHYMINKISSKKPSVLWCYQKELGFSSHRKKRAKQQKKAVKAGTADPENDDPFELFVSSTNIRYCYYKETEQVLGKTFGVCILQDFEALTPNLLCRTIETVEGGGMVILLLKTMDSLKHLYDLAMDSHASFRTEVHTDIEPRFNERLVLSLAGCTSCLCVDDELNILPISTHAKFLKPIDASAEDEQEHSETPKTKREQDLEEIKTSTADSQPLGPILNVARTVDQAKALMTFVDVVSEKTLNRTVALTAGRGRGKSASLGLAIASAVAYGYSNIFVTAPSPENLGTVFEFVVKGFDALGMTEHQNYELVQAENPELNKALVRINVFRDHRQTIQYVAPGDWQHLAQAELLVIDEAAAIPLPMVKKLLGPYLVLISSTVNGYEGTGRALSLKLIEDLRKGKSVGRAGQERTLKELTLEEPIRYAPGDGIEAWLNRLLCLDAAQVPKMQLSTLPMPSECQLFLVNRDALFSHHEASEKFLFKMMSLFVSSHYKNSPNDLLLMADAPAHHLLVMLPPIDANAEHTELPEVMVAIQIAMEGALSQESVQASLRRGKLPSGDLIPWTLSQQFLHDSFAQLSGARIVRVATHPALHRKGYASEAMKQLVGWFEDRSRASGSFGDAGPEKKNKRGKKSGQDAAQGGSANLLQEIVEPREVPPLLEAVSEVPPPYKLDYLGTSFGLTSDLYEFWRKSGFKPAYLRQIPHSATGEHSAILLRTLTPLEGEARAAPIIDHFVSDFRNRFLRLLQGPFREQPTRLALSIVDPTHDAGEADAGVVENQAPLTATSLLQFLSRDDIHRIQSYGKNLVEYGLILDLVPAISALYLGRRMPEMKLSPLQSAILVAVGCQHRTFDQLSKEFNAPASQLLALFNKAMHKMGNHFRGLLERQVEEEEDAELAKDGARRPLRSGEVMAGGSFVKDSLKEEQTAAAKKVNKKLAAARESMLESLNSDFAVAANEDDLREAVGDKVPTGSISVARKRGAEEPEEKAEGGGRKGKRGRR